MNTNILQLTTLLNNDFHLKGISENKAYLYVELKANKVDTTEERIPLNISLVVDRSGSMKGKKIEYVKKAVQFVIDHLNQADNLSIVQYDSVVDVLSASASVTNKELLRHKVKSIYARGATNLSGGMLEGYTQVQSTKQEQGFVNRVLLLSDGLANNGVTDPQKLQHIVQQKFRADGIGLSTFGVGADFNEVLMTNLSEYGGANYYYIDSPEKIPEIFAQELEGLLSVVAQSTYLTVKLPNTVKCTKVYGYPAEIKDGNVFIRFNDVFSEEEKGVVLELEWAETFTESLTFSTQVQYDDVAITLNKVSEQQEISLQMTDSAAQYKASIHAKAEENVALFIANDRYEAAIKLADARKFKEVKKCLQDILTFLQPYVDKYPDAMALIKQHQQIKDYLNQLGEMEQMDVLSYVSYQKRSRSRNYMSKRKKY